MQVFGKDLKDIFERQDEGTVVVIITRPGGDELYHPDDLPEPDMSRLRKWTRCGNPADLRPEWKDNSNEEENAKVKAYLAGQDLGVDYTM